MVTKFNKFPRIRIWPDYIDMLETWHNTEQIIDERGGRTTFNVPVGRALALVFRWRHDIADERYPE